MSLAVNGLTEADENEGAPGKLPRTIAFANTIARSKWYAAALMDSKVLNITTRRLEGDVPLHRRIAASARLTATVEPADQALVRPVRQPQPGSGTKFDTAPP